MSIISMVASLCLLCAPEAWAQKRRSERELAGLAGPVRVVREYRTFSRRGLKPAEISELPGGRPYRTVTYDRGGEFT